MWRDVVGGIFNGSPAIRITMREERWTDGGREGEIDGWVDEWRA